MFLYFFRCEAAGVTEVFIHMAVYLMTCRYFCLKFFYFQLFIPELRLIYWVKSKSSYFHHV